MTSTFRLHLMRHGQTFSNVAGALDTGAPGADLTDLGQAQAAAAAHALADAQVGGLYVSRLVRTHQTVAPLASRLGLDPHELGGIHEITAGSFEMKTDQESVHGYIGTVGAWINGDLDTRMPGGESGHEFESRYTEDVRAIAADGHSEALLVSHGAAIRAWVSMALGDLGSRPEAHAPLNNTAVITLEGHPDRGWELVRWQGTPVGGDFLDSSFGSSGPAPDPTARTED